MPFDNPNMNQQAMMAQYLRAKAPEPMEEGLPEGCKCGECPIAEQCMAAGGGPKTPEDEGGAMPGGMGGGMKGMPA